MSYYENIMDLAAVCRDDPAFIQIAKNALRDSGLAEMCGYEKAKRADPFGPLPADWSALQFCIFDNGAPEQKRKRAKIQPTIVRYGANIKVWTGDQVNFNNRKSVEWNANAYLWTTQDAAQIARDLHDARLITASTVEMVDAWISPGDEGLRYSIPMAKVGVASRWMSDHLVISSSQDGVPSGAIIIAPDCSPVTLGQSSFVNEAPDGKALQGNAKLQARAARSSTFAGWSTVIVE